MEQLEDKAPFVYGKLAMNHEFTNREDEYRLLKRNFTSGINTILISPRRWGKTSLVHKVAQSLTRDKKVIVCQLDLFAVRNEEEFYQLYVKELLTITSGKWKTRIEYAKSLFKKIVPTFNVGLDPNTDFSVGLDFKEIEKAPEEILNLAENIAKLKGLRIVVCIDEFQNIAHFNHPEAFQKKLRSCWQKHQQASYCLYGSKKHLLSELFSSPSQPFYKFGDLIFLNKIDAPYWEKFIVQRFSDTGKKIKPEQAIWIAAKMENHPYFVQQLAQATWFRTLKSCNDQVMESALEALLWQHSILFQREIDHLTNMQLNFLKAVCNNIKQLSAKETLQDYQLGTSANVIRIKEALESKELIDTSGQEILILDPLFKIWLKRIYFKSEV